MFPIVVPVCKRGLLSPKAKLPKKHCLKNGTVVETVVMRDENILDATEALEFLHSSTEVVAV